MRRIYYRFRGLFAPTERWPLQHGYRVGQLVWFEYMWRRQRELGRVTEVDHNGAIWAWRSVLKVRL